MALSQVFYDEAVLHLATVYGVKLYSVHIMSDEHFFVINDGAKAYCAGEEL